MIASSAFFVLDAILDWPVANYDGSWSQWGQLASEPIAGTVTTGGMLKADSPWRTDVPSRSELVVYNYNFGAVSAIGAVTFTGTGTNDLTTSGTFTGTIDRRFRIQIDGGDPANPNTFRWTKDSGATTIVWDGSAINITGTHALTEGISVTFGAATGHISNDRWDFAVPTNRRAVELLALDGSICSSRLNMDGTIAYSPAACTPLLPNSYAPSANQIEEEDAVYFGAGGGTVGGGGGAPITPGY